MALTSLVAGAEAVGTENPVCLNVGEDCVVARGALGSVSTDIVILFADNACLCGMLRGCGGGQGAARHLD